MPHIDTNYFQLQCTYSKEKDEKIFKWIQAVYAFHCVAEKIYIKV